MALEYVELGTACDDCTIAVANDDYSGMDESQEQQTRAGLERLARIIGGVGLVVGPDRGFRHSSCCVCSRHQGGDKHEIGYFVPLKLSVSRIRLNQGGYDRRGRYWGIGAPLFHVASDFDSVNYELRAADRDAAIDSILQHYPGASFHRGAGRPRLTSTL